MAEDESGGEDNWLGIKTVRCYDGGHKHSNKDRA